MGIVAAAGVAAGGLEGRTVAIEGFGAAGAAVVTAMAAEGARLVAVAGPEGTVVAPEGLDVGALSQAWADDGDAALGALDAGPLLAPGTVLGVEADVLVVGSKPGVIDHGVAAGVSASAVVPGGPVPVTAKALAVLRRAGVVVVPDFVSTAGPLFAGWPLDGATTDPAVAAAEAVAGSLREVLGHEQGPLLGACLRAESFLATWREDLPFGRPLA